MNKKTNQFFLVFLSVSLLVSCSTLSKTIEKQQKLQEPNDKGNILLIGRILDNTTKKNKTIKTYPEYKLVIQDTISNEKYDLDTNNEGYFVSTSIPRGYYKILRCEAKNSFQKYIEFNNERYFSTERFAVNNLGEIELNKKNNTYLININYDKVYNYFKSKYISSEWLSYEWLSTECTAIYRRIISIGRDHK